MRLLPIALLAALAFAGGAHATCVGNDLIAALPPSEMQALRAATDAVPYPSGNRWRAERDGKIVDLVGTYHLADPRLDPMVTSLLPVLDNATRLLVEAGPDEEQALKDRIGKEPSLVVITDGPTLPETLPPETWQHLSQAMTNRGIPSFMAAKLRPWYISIMLAIPTCAMSSVEEAGGLDKQLIDAAHARGKPVQALEPYDTVFRIFDSMPPVEQLSMVTSALAMEDVAEDMSATMAAQYFAGENRIIWEFMRMQTLRLPGYTPERVAKEFATMQEAMVDSRNRDWIAVIEKAAEDGPILVAFGALHLPGEQGVLNLMAQSGWTVTQLVAP